MVFPRAVLTETQGDPSPGVSHLWKVHQSTYNIVKHWMPREKKTKTSKITFSPQQDSTYILSDTGTKFFIFYVTERHMDSKTNPTRNF